MPLGRIAAVRGNLSKIRLSGNALDRGLVVEILEKSGLEHVEIQV